MMQVPTVTLEDLEAFQRKHFPSQHQSSAQGDDLPTHEDDLGFYPDGVKRTLTDEQVEMFRHTEIHSLIRKRQLEKEDAEDEAPMELSLQDNTDDEYEKRSMDPEARVENDESRQERRLEKQKPNAELPTTKSLDYGNESSHPPTPPKSTPAANPPVSQDTYQGRRIVSYDD